MPLIEPVRWKLGKQLMPHLLPCSAVILFVRISEICFNFISLSWILLSEAIRKRFICALQGHRQGTKGKVFKMIFRPCRKISPKQRMTFPVAPGCRTSRRKPRPGGLEKEL